MSDDSDHFYLVGLDPPSLSTISSLLYCLAEKHSPRVVLALRPQDPLPKWVTHVIYLDSETSVAYQGPKKGALGEFISQEQSAPQLVPFQGLNLGNKTRKNIVVNKRREQSPIVEVALASNETSESDEALERDEALESDKAWASKEALESSEILESKEALVEMKGVKVMYGTKKVLGAWQEIVDGQPQNGLWWTVRRGERWGVFGPNGRYSFMEMHRTY